MIDWNKKRYLDLDVEFRVLDICSQAPPKADVVFIRQVLQHLSNEDIKKALSNISGKYAYMILTEHLPHDTNFEPNIDKITGPNIRANFKHKKSGVDITKPPFSFPFKSEKMICEVSDELERICTFIYEF